MSKPQSFSEGEEQKPVKKVKVKSEDHNESKLVTHAHSDENDDGAVHQAKGPHKIRKNIPVKASPTADGASPDERKLAKRTTKPRGVEEKIKIRRTSDISTDDIKLKKTPTPSARSTPVPPEKASTPEVVRERRREAERQVAEANRKAAEAEVKKREEEESARKAAEEEEARRKAAAEAEAKRLAEEAEAARRREEEEARKRAEEEERRQQRLVARQTRISQLPRALRRACELGTNRPLHFSGEELGIKALFLPLFNATSKDLRPTEDGVCKSYIMSFQAVGILGLPELDLAHLDPPYSAWERLEVTPQQRELFAGKYDFALLAQDYRFPLEGTSDYDFAKIQQRVREARQQFMDMDGLYWIEDSVLYPEVEKIESLHPLVDEIKDLSKRIQIHLSEPATEAAPEKRHRPRKSFMDRIVSQKSVNGISSEGVKVNGEG